MKAHRLINKAVLIVLFVIPISFSVAWSLTSQQVSRMVARIAFPSVVLLEMKDAHGQPLSVGSGFFVSPNIVATNLHVIAGASGGYAKPVYQETKYNIAGTVGINENADLVLLHIDNLMGKPLPLEQDVDVQIGDEVYAVGNPLGLEGTFSKGIVSGIRRVGSTKIYQITSPISSGSSGGPVMNNKGKVIGVSVATIKGGQNLNFAIPVLYLNSLMSNRTTLRPLMVQKEILRSDKFGGAQKEGIEVRFEDDRAWWKRQSKILFEVLQGCDDAGCPSSDSGIISFSIYNKMKNAAYDIKWVIMWQDKDGNHIDTQHGITRGPVLPHLAHRESIKAPDEIYSRFEGMKALLIDLKMNYLKKAKEYRLAGFSPKVAVEKAEEWKERKIRAFAYSRTYTYSKFNIRIIDYRIGETDRAKGGSSKKPRWVITDKPPLDPGGEKKEEKKAREKVPVEKKTLTENSSTRPIKIQEQDIKE